jgi:hypothetical protein
MPHLYNANYTSAYRAPRLGLWVNKVRISLDPVRRNSTENIWSGTRKWMTEEVKISEPYMLYGKHDERFIGLGRRMGWTCDKDGRE